MGTWGYGISDNDTFCEVIELFKEQICNGIPLEDVTLKIQNKFENGPDSFLATLAIAESLWRLGRFTENDFAEVKRIVEDGNIYNYLMELDADETFIRNFHSSLSKFLEHLSQKPTTNQKWSIKKSRYSLQKGVCFWYKDRGNIYGATVLEMMTSEEKYYLIAISEKLDSIPRSVPLILSAQVYTIAWFGEEALLNPRQLHIIGEAYIHREYKNKYGIRIEPEKIEISNVGQSQTWNHSYRAIVFDNKKLEDFIN